MQSRALCETCADTKMSTALHPKPPANKGQEENQNELTYVLWNRSMKYVHTSFLNAITSSVKPKDILSGKQSNKKHCHIQLKQICKQ